MKVLAKLTKKLVKVKTADERRARVVALVGRLNEQAGCLEDHEDIDLSVWCAADENWGCLFNRKAYFLDEPGHKDEFFTLVLPHLVCSMSNQDDYALVIPMQIKQLPGQGSKATRPKDLILVLFHNGRSLIQLMLELDRSCSPPALQRPTVNGGFSGRILDAFGASVDYALTRSAPHLAKLVSLWAGVEVSAQEVSDMEEQYKTEFSDLMRDAFNRHNQTSRYDAHSIIKSGLQGRLI